MKKLIIGIVIIIALVLIVRSCGSKDTVKYATAKAGYSTITDIVSESGNLTPPAVTEVFSSINGIVDEMYVENGEKVAVDDSLFYVVNSLTGDERTIHAPAKGTVVNLSIGDHSKVSPAPGASTAGQAGATPALLIADLSNYTIKLQINEVDIHKIKAGQDSEVTFDAAEGKTFKGKVLRVDEVGTDTQSVITYNVYVSIEDLTNDIRPTMTANVDIEAARRKHALTVPNSAIKPYKGGKAVRVLNKKTQKIKYVPVKLGIIGTLKTEILKGLKAGDPVVTGTTEKANASPFALRGSG